MNFLALFADAKVQPFSQTIKSFFNFFSPLLELNAPFLKAGAKVQPFFKLTKLFLKNIFLVYSYELHSLSKSGCKSNTSFPIEQMFFYTLSIVISHLIDP